MIERRLVIDPQDILHVEIRCSECDAANLLPVRDPERLATFKRPNLPGEFNVYTQCFSWRRSVRITTSGLSPASTRCTARIRISSSVA